MYSHVRSLLYLLQHKLCISVTVSRSYESVVLFVIDGIGIVVISYLFYTSSLCVSYAQQSSFMGHHASQVYF